MKQEMVPWARRTHRRIHHGCRVTTSPAASRRAGLNLLWLLLLQGCPVLQGFDSGRIRHGPGRPGGIQERRNAPIRWQPQEGHNEPNTRPTVKGWMRRSEDDAENTELAPKTDAKAPLLFRRQEEVDETTSTTPSFGQSVSIRSRPRTAPLPSRTPPAAAATETTFQLGNILVDDKNGSMINNRNGQAAAAVATKDDDRSEARIAADNLLRRNKLVAVASITLAICSWTWQVFHPVPPIQLLADMERRSVDVSVVGKNGKPTLVDFWAPWCENCKVSAATMHAIETEYADRVNFIVVNGDDMVRNGKLVEAFRVDAIPHLALVEADGTVDTALIGPVPKRVLRADLDVLVENSTKKDAKQREALPYQMLDVFENQPPEDRRVSF